MLLKNVHFRSLSLVKMEAVKPGWLYLILWHVPCYQRINLVNIYLSSLQLLFNAVCGHEKSSHSALLGYMTDFFSLSKTTEEV